MNRMIVFLLLVSNSWLIAQQSPDHSQNQTTRNDHVKVQGCVSRISGDFVLMQTDPANSYVLEASRNLKFEHYLGQQVEVTGDESPTMSSSSTYRKSPAGSVTITVTSITTISKRCTH